MFYVPGSWFSHLELILRDCAAEEIDRLTVVFLYIYIWC